MNADEDQWDELVEAVGMPPCRANRPGTKALLAFTTTHLWKLTGAKIPVSFGLIGA